MQRLDGEGAIPRSYAHGAKRITPPMTGGASPIRLPYPSPFLDLPEDARETVEQQIATIDTRIKVLEASYSASSSACATARADLRVATERVERAQRRRRDAPAGSAIQCSFAATKLRRRSTKCNRAS
jgi:hypothetical protein